MDSNRLRHMVIFNLSFPKGSAESEEFLRMSRELLAVIPGVENFEVCRQVSPKNDFDYGFSMEFADKDAFEAYMISPAHTAYVEAHWLTKVVKFLEIDFMKK